MLHVHSLMLPPLVKVKGNGLLRLVPPLKKRQWRHIDILVSHGVHGRKLALCVNLAKAKALGKKNCLVDGFNENILSQHLPDETNYFRTQTNS